MPAECHYIVKTNYTVTMLILLAQAISTLKPQTIAKTVANVLITIIVHVSKQCASHCATVGPLVTDLPNNQASDIVFAIHLNYVNLLLVSLQKMLSWSLLVEQSC